MRITYLTIKKSDPVKEERRMLEYYKNFKNTFNKNLNDELFLINYKTGEITEYLGDGQETTKNFIGNESVIEERIKEIEK